MTLNRLVIAQPPAGLQRTIILDQTNENASFFTPSEQTYIREEKESLGIPLWDADPHEWEQYLWKKHQNEKLGVKENLERTLGHIGLGGSIVHYWYRLQRLFCTKRSKPTQPHLFRSQSIQKQIKENDWRSGATKWFSNLKPLPLQTPKERTHPTLNINFENSNPPCSPHSPIASNPLNLLHSNYVHPLHRPFEPRHKALAGIEILQSPPKNHQPLSQTPALPLAKATQVLLVRFDNPLAPAQHDRITNPAQLRPNPLILNAIADPTRVAPNTEAKKATRLPRPQAPVGIKPMQRDQQDQRPTLPESLSNNHNFSGGISRQQVHPVASTGVVPGANANAKNNLEARHKDLLDHIKRPVGLRERDLNRETTPLKEISLPGIRKLEENEKERSQSPTVKRILNENESPRVIRYRHPLPMDEENTEIG